MSLKMSDDVRKTQKYDVKICAEISNKFSDLNEYSGGTGHVFP